ncbi:50S ribosomal protein L6 [Candidatus Bathyarchaeota archaeon]|nr:MAG: 50S ribosomal protein L6 [Candidatus Bathyarchaeota archaeon]
MFERVVEIPENVEVNIDGDDVRGYTVKVKGPKGENSKKLKYRGVHIELTNRKIKVYSELRKNKYKAMVGTFSSLVSNLIKGVTEGFEYKLKVFYSHFPIKVKVVGNEVLIENFLGEKHPRKAKIVGNTKVIVKDNEITVSGIDKENCGQTAANLEMVTKIKKLDPRIFQDGIYIVKKPK